MATASVKHVRRADSRLVLLGLALVGVLATLALPVSALANTTGGAQAMPSTVTAESTETGASGGAAPAEPQKTNKPTLATWFGPGFYGDKTACGQTMSPELVGVASRPLPCGTLVQIGYRGRRLTVPVVDRGPYGHIGAVWDLTAGTARALKIKETVRVWTAIVGSLPNTPTLGEPAVAAPTASSAPSAAASSTGGAAAGASSPRG